MNVEQASLRPLSPADIAILPTLAREIWSACYASIVSAPQLDYMLGGRFTAANLRRYIGSEVRWFDVMSHGGELVGYCSYALEPAAYELKLEQLYLLPRVQGRGWGGTMLRHVETHARAVGREVVVLQVNKHNANALALYRAFGYEIRTAAVFDIGNGFVMDDYVMHKRVDAV